MKKGLITGVWGQDGSYMAELLSQKGYEVHGIARYPLSLNATRIKSHLIAKGCRVIEHECDLHSFLAVKEQVEQIQPDEVYHLAASHYSSQYSPAQKAALDDHIFSDNVSPAMHLLESIRMSCSEARFVVAGSCLVFEATESSIQDEKTSCKAYSLYGHAKIAVRQLAAHFRCRHGLHASVAILYNHESPRRGEEFVTRKIVKNMVAIRQGRLSVFPLGSLSEVKDWGYAREYVYGMWLMARQKHPDDYILASGVQHTVGEFLAATAEALHIQNWQQHVDDGEQGITRQSSVSLVGDATKARVQLGWQATCGLRKLVGLMVDSELSGSLD
jgi:GDPmannose 4,6-dehydratase